MNKRKMKKAEKLSINSDRLNDNIEQHSVEWLFRDRTISGYRNNLEMIKRAILCMDEGHSNYQNLSVENKEKVEDLIKNTETVDKVIVTIFQWFGTTVGKYEISELMTKIMELEHKRTTELM